jgi:hypothetical protein
MLRISSTRMLPSLAQTGIIEAAARTPTHKKASTRNGEYFLKNMTYLGLSETF